MIYFLAEKSISQFAHDALRSIGAFFDTYIYMLVANLYRLFFYVSEVKIVDYNLVSVIFKNFQLIVAVVVMFSIAIALINYIVNPDNMKNGKTPASKLVSKIIISFILLLSVNTIFSSAYKLQNAIIENNFLGKLILGRSYDAQSVESNGMGIAFSKGILKVFITDNEDLKGEIPPYNIQGADGTNSSSNFYLFPLITANKEFTAILEYINDKSEDDEYVVNTNPLSILVGAFICWILVSYIVGIAVRVVQLLYLQLIAPIPILMYVMPGGDNKLSAWGKQCFTTYIDLFIRHIIIYITLFLCSMLLSGSIQIPAGAEDIEGWIIIAIVIGILLFAKKAPDLIKELFPSSSKASGDLGLDLGKQFKGTGVAALAGLGAGAISGGAVGLASGGGLGGAVGGMFRGGFAGLTGKKISDANKKTAQYGNMRRDQGIGGISRFGRNIQTSLGLQDAAARYENEISELDSQAKLGEAIIERGKDEAYRNNMNTGSITGTYTDINGVTSTVTASGNIRDLKESIERSRATGRRTFDFDGQAFDINSATEMLRNAERNATNAMIDSGTDAQINAMMDHYTNIDNSVVDAATMRTSNTGAKTRRVQIENSDGYIRARRRKGK